MAEKQSGGAVAEAEIVGRIRKRKNRNKYVHKHTHTNQIILINCCTITPL